MVPYLRQAQERAVASRCKDSTSGGRLSNAALARSENIVCVPQKEVLECIEVQDLGLAKARHEAAMVLWPFVQLLLSQF